MRLVVHVRRRIEWRASASRMFRKVVHIAYKRPDFVMINTGKDSYLLIYLFYAFLWVIPQSPNFICRRFGTLCLFHLHRRTDLSAYEDGTDRLFRNVSK
jgi:hypothetical protein